MKSFKAKNKFVDLHIYKDHIYANLLCNVEQQLNNFKKIAH